MPLLLALGGGALLEKAYWGHSLVEHVGEELGGPNLLFRLPMVLEGLAVVFLLLALLDPVYPFVLNRVERGGLEIMFVFDLSQSMEEPLSAAGGKSAPPSLRLPARWTP